MSTNQQQVAALLQSLIARGVETKDAIPTLKALIEAKIFSLDDHELNSSNVPQSIPEKVRKKIISKQKSSPRKKRKTNPIVIPPVASQPETILINRSPVLTLWASVVASKLFDLSWDESLTLGSALAAQIAQAKGTSLGIYKKDTKLQPTTTTTTAPSPLDDSGQREFALMGHVIQAMTTPVGIRAILENDKEQDPERTWKLLQKKFGEDSLGYIIREMQKAADNAGNSLADTAYNYYTHVRPDIPEGTKGWGAHGVLDTSKLRDFYPSCSIQEEHLESKPPAKKS